MAGAVDYIGSLVLTGTANVTIPLRQGSKYVADLNLRRPRMASPVPKYGSPVVVQGLYQPMLYIKTYAMTNWFSIANLLAMFKRDGNGQVGSAGHCRWAYAGEAAIQWAACKIDRMLISWGAIGEGVCVEMVIMPYGNRENVSNVTHSFTYGPPWRANDLTYIGFSNVWQGQVLLQNQLRADTSSPYIASPDGCFYPVNYLNDSLLASLGLVQSSLATFVKDGVNSRTFYGGAVVFRDATRTLNATLTMALTSPSRTDEVTFGPGKIGRQYDAVPGSNASPSILITGNA